MLPPTHMRAPHHHRCLPLQRLRLEAAVVSMQRLYRRELYRKRQWQRLLDVVHQVVDNVRSTRSAIDTWAEEVDSAAKAKTEEVLEMSRRWGAGECGGGCVMLSICHVRCSVCAGCCTQRHHSSTTAPL